MTKTIGKCSISDCRNKRHALGLCAKHYARLRKYGDPYTVRPNARRFPDDAKKHGDCLLWDYRIDSHGYGRVNVDGKTALAHRHAWELRNGLIPEGLLVDHSCHNRTCVNTAHLRLATRAQNNANRSGATVESSTGVRNVHPVSGGKFNVLIRHGGVLKYYGTYSTAEEAARVAEETRAELFGSFAGRG